MGGVFIVIIAGLFLAVITLGFEFCYYKKKDHSRVESAVVKISGLGEYVKKKANVLQNSFINDDHKLSKEDIISTAAFVKAGYLSNDVIDNKV